MPCASRPRVLRTWSWAFKRPLLVAPRHAQHTISALRQACPALLDAAPQLAAGALAARDAPGAARQGLKPYARAAAAALARWCRALAAPGAAGSAPGSLGGAGLQGGLHGGGAARSGEGAAPGRGDCARGAAGVSGRDPGGCEGAERPGVLTEPRTLGPMPLPSGSRSEAGTCKVGGASSELDGAVRAKPCGAERGGDAERLNIAAELFEAAARPETGCDAPDVTACVKESP